MFTLHKLQSALRNNYVRAALALLLIGTAALFSWRSDVPQDTGPIMRSQDISQITALATQRDKLEYLMVAAPLSEAPRYIFKLKGDPVLHVIKVPSTSHLSLEREVLLRNNIPYSIAREDYLASHKAVLVDEDDSKLARAGGFLRRHAVDILLIGLVLFLVRHGIPGTGVSATVLNPDQLQGSMDDLIGMEDIKQEVLHLEDMIRNRAVYREHDIDKPFNVMLTGPAGTG